MNQNLLLSSINTDRDLASILDQFSEDSIESIIVESLKYKFAPYADRKPNLPYVINNHFVGIRNNYTGSDHDTINTKEYNTYLVIINKICEAYNLQLINEVPYESAYSLAYALYQILISEFTDRISNCKNFDAKLIEHGKTIFKKNAISNTIDIFVR